MVSSVVNYLVAVCYYYRPGCEYENMPKRRLVQCPTIDVDAALSSALHSVPPRLSTAADQFAGTASVRKQRRSTRSTESDVNVRVTVPDGRWLHTEVRRYV